MACGLQKERAREREGDKEDIMRNLLKLLLLILCDSQCTEWTDLSHKNAQSINSLSEMNSTE